MTTPAAHFYDVAHIFESTLGADARVRRALELTGRVLPCDRLVLFDLRATLASPLVFVPDITEGERPAVARRISQLADLLRDDAVLDRRVVQVAESMDGVAHLAVPMVGEGRVVGVILVESATGAYEAKHVAILSVVAGQVAAYLTLLCRDRACAERITATTASSAALARAVELGDAVTARLVPMLRSGLDAHALLRLADRLEDLVRIRTGVGLATERGPVDLARVCRAAIDALHATHPGAFVGLGTMGDPTCDGDGARLAQAVGELLENALSHGETDTTAVVVDGTASELVLRCHNDGVLSETRVAAIFDPVPGDPRKCPLALGLGLLIVHRIVADHGGTLELRSSAETGTTFVMRLPRSVAR